MYLDNADILLAIGVAFNVFASACLLFRVQQLETKIRNLRG